MGSAPASSIPTIVLGKKIRPVVLVESTRAIIPECRLRRTIGAAASAELAPSARVASICRADEVTSSPRRFSATAAAVIALPITMPPTGTRYWGVGSKMSSARTSPRVMRAAVESAIRSGPRTPGTWPHGPARCRRRTPP